MTGPNDFTYEDLIACPQPQAAIPSPDGTRAISFADEWDSIRISRPGRFKDKWRVPGKVHTVGLVKLVYGEHGWRMGDIGGKQFYNVLGGTGLSSQVPSFHVALTPSHIAVATRPPKICPALSIRMDIYLFPLNRTCTSSALTALPINLTSGHDHGEVEFLVASKDGSEIAWTERAVELDAASKRNLFVWDRAAPNDVDREACQYEAVVCVYDLPRMRCSTGLIGLLDSLLKGKLGVPPIGSQDED
ncbi:hypothetical protein IAU59_006797 [Kwoniella sp. CBS 9459]